MAEVPNVRLNNGVEIPQLGFGVFQIPPPETEAATLMALEVGYRHIDTAQMYANEGGVGSAVRKSGLQRDEVFITSKLNNGFHARDEALAAFDRTLAALEMDYIDLFLIHWPLPAHDRYVEAWRALEEIHASGRARAIGVSNFHEEHLERLAREGLTTPAVNQIEAHPYLTQEALRATNAARGIATEAWSPIARGRVLNDPVVVKLANEIGRSPSQVVLRWAVQRGDIVFPKSTKLARVKENFELFDFQLSDSQMDSISALNRSERVGPDPEEFNWIP